MKIILNLTKTQYEQLIWYIELAERDGTYYGNKDQFQKRHEKIKEQLTVSAPGNINPEGKNESIEASSAAVHETGSGLFSEHGKFGSVMNGMAVKTKNPCLSMGKRK